ncbi:MAG: insulinase family protein [Bacteroidia bacterium]|nr:insulinase family protein [Bacteroidia bacterium]
MSKINFSTFYLENGLKVLVHEDHSIPKVVLDVVYKVGARDEDPSLTGFAHLFEHLMFGGSRNIPQFDTPLQRAGGDNNAFTNNDLTNYYISLPSNQVETAFWLESDRMLELDFSQKSLDVQKSVVIEEFKQRYLNKPYGDAHLILRKTHFKVHPYRWPTIGMDISHIEGATLDAVKDFFYGFYAPNNATLVLAGDITLDQARRLSEKWFGPIPRRELKKHNLPVEPPQTEARSETVYRDVPFPAVYKMFHIPGKNDPGYYPADLITDLLSHGRASRLYQTLVIEKQLVSSVRAFSWGAHDPGMISLDATLAKGVEPAQYDEALAQLLEEVQELEEAEVVRIKNAIETHNILEKTTILNRAVGLAVSDAQGDPDLINTAIDNYLKIPVDELKESARKILAPSNCSTLYYMPNHAK